jgi:hypothetical protein
MGLESLPCAVCQERRPFPTVPEDLTEGLYNGFTRSKERIASPDICDVCLDRLLADGTLVQRTPHSYWVMKSFLDIDLKTARYKVDETPGCCTIH